MMCMTPSSVGTEKSLRDCYRSLTVNRRKYECNEIPTSYYGPADLVV